MNWSGGCRYVGYRNAGGSWDKHPSYSERSEPALHRVLPCKSKEELLIELHECKDAILLTEIGSKQRRKFKIRIRALKKRIGYRFL